MLGKSLFKFICIIALFSLVFGTAYYHYEKKNQEEEEKQKRIEYLKAKYDQFLPYANQYVGFFNKTQSLREATWWEKHKWKVIGGAAVVGGVALIAFTGGAATPAVAGGAACVSSAAIGTAAILSPTALCIGGGALVLVGSNFSESDLKTDGGKAFIGGSVINYMKNNNITLTQYQKNYIKETINKNYAAIAYASKDKEDFFRRLDACVLQALKACR